MAKSRIPLPESAKVKPMKTALMAGREYCERDGSLPFDVTKLWFHDPPKLLAAVLLYAQGNPRFAHDFVSAAGTLAADPSNKKLRTAITKALLTKHSKSVGRSRKEPWFCTVLAIQYRQLRIDEGMKSGEAYELLGETHRLSASRVRQLVARSDERLGTVTKSDISRKDSSHQE